MEDVTQPIPDFIEIFERNKHKGTMVEIPQRYIDLIDDFVDPMIRRKMEESGRQKDDGHMEKRELSGKYGEVARMLLCGQDPETTNIFEIGNSEDFNSPDLKGYSVGVKSSLYGNFPLMYESTKNIIRTESQIICVRMAKDSPMVCVLGFAPFWVCQKNLSHRLVHMESALAKGKLAFYGFDFLKPFKSLEDIEDFKTDLN